MSEEQSPEISAEPSESVESHEEIAQEASPEEQKAIEKMEREFLLKVNGKEQKTKIDLNDSARITKALQMEMAAQTAFQERAITAKQLAEIQGDVAEFLEQFTTDPLSVVMSKDFNISKEQKRALAEAILREDLEESQKSPEEIELEETKRRYQELLEEKEAIEAQRRADEKEYLEQQASIQLEAEVSSAIESGALPKSKYMTKKLADLAYIAYMNGVDLSIADLIPFVKEQYKKDMMEMSRGMSDDEIEEIISKDRIRSIRNKQIQAVKPKDGAPKSPLKTEDIGSSTKKVEEAKKLSAKEFFNSLKG